MLHGSKSCMHAFTRKIGHFDLVLCDTCKSTLQYLPVNLDVSEIRVIVESACNLRLSFQSLLKLLMLSRHLLRCAQGIFRHQDGVVSFHFALQITVEY